MIKFLIRISIFICVIIIIMVGNYVFNNYQLHKVPSLKNPKILVIGDSRMMTAINPALLDNCVNTAQNSESYIISYYKLKYLLKYNKNIKQVLLGFSYPSFSGYLDKIFKNDVATGDVLNRIYPIMSLNNFGTLDVDHSKYYQVVFKNLFVYPHTNHHKYLGGFVKQDSALSKANLNTVIQRHYFDTKGNNIGVSVCAAQYLDSIIYLTQKNNIELVLINAPLHPDYLNKIPANFKMYFEEIKQKCVRENIRVLDYGNLPFENKYFKDYNHLSFEGANYLTELVKKDLNH